MGPGQDHLVTMIPACPCPSSLHWAIGIARPLEEDTRVNTLLLAEGPEQLVHMYVRAHTYTHTCSGGTTPPVSIQLRAQVWELGPAVTPCVNSGSLLPFLGLDFPL